MSMKTVKQGNVSMLVERSVEPMRKLLGIILFSVVISSAAAEDCSCGMLEGSAISILTSDRLYTARLLTAEYQTADSAEGEGFAYRVEVIEALRGKLGPSTVLSGFSPRNGSCWRVPDLVPGDYFLTDGDFTSPCGVIEKKPLTLLGSSRYSFLESVALELISMSPKSEALINPDAYNRDYKKVLRCIEDS